MKPQHRCGVQAENARKDAPVLEFIFLCGVENAWPGETDAVAPHAASPAKPAKNIANRPGEALLPPYSTAHRFPVMYPWKVLNNRALIETLRPGGLVRDLCLTETGNVTEQCVTRNLSARGGAAFGAGCGHSRIRLVDLPILIRLAKKHASARLEVMLRFDWPCWQEIDLGVTFAASAAGMKNMA